MSREDAHNASLIHIFFVSLAVVRIRVVMRVQQFSAVLIVIDLSAAEIPVVTPSLASIETVNAVSNLPSFLLSIKERPSFSD